MKILIPVMLLLIALLQQRLWLGDGSIKEIQAYQVRLVEIVKEVEEKKQRNQALKAEILDLQQGQEALEERAREEMGMIREGESFFQVIE
jgi:cell division protein FtsB